MELGQCGNDVNDFKGNLTVAGRSDIICDIFNFLISGLGSKLSYLLVCTRLYKRLIGGVEPVVKDLSSIQMQKQKPQIK